MKRNLLLALFAVLMGIGVMSAENINIDVDNAANVEVSVDNGAITIPLQDGMNRITDYTAANSPLMIRAAEGASIVSVTKNNADVLTPNGGGFYTLAIENMMLTIVTEGGEQGDKNLKVWFQLSGAAGSATINVDGADVPFSSATSNYADIKSGAECLIAPAADYIITNVDAGYGTATDNNDGTWTFTTTHDYDMVTVYTEEKPVEGTSFTVKTNYLPNLALQAFRNTNTGYEFQDVPVKADGTAVLPEGWEYMIFLGVDDAQISSLKRNGEDVQFNVWMGCWSSYVEEGDVIDVTTVGPEIDVMFYSNTFDRDGVGLENFLITSDDETFSLTGGQETVKLHRGSFVTVQGKGLSICDWVMCGMQYIAEAPFTFNVENNNLITISGRAVSGVNVRVTDASAIIAKQLNGRGDQLELQDGDNNFEASDIVNNLNIVPAEGCEIRSIYVNQQIISMTGSEYSIEVEDGMLIDINARHIPTTVPVTVMVLDTENDEALSDALAKKLTLTYTAGEQTETVELTQGMTSVMVPYQALVSVSTDAFGFVIDGVEAGQNFVQQSDNAYIFYASEPCMLNVKMHEIVAPEGYALVSVSSKGGRFPAIFLPYDENMQRLDGSIKSDVPGVLKIGSYVEVCKISFDFYFKSITVNGEPLKDADGNVIDFEAEPREYEQSYFVKIEGDCTIAAELFDPLADYVELTAWNCNNLTYPICIAPLYFLDGQELVDRYNVLPGSEVTMVVPYVAPGFNLISVNQVGGNNTFALTDFEAAQDGYYTVKYTVPDEIADGNMFIFQPVCQMDAANTPYVIEFYPTYVEENGYQEVVGYLAGIDFNENREATMLFALEGQTVSFNGYERDDYTLIGAIATHGDTSGAGNIYTRELPLELDEETNYYLYEVNPADAFEFHGYLKINLQGVYKLKSESSLSGVATDGALSFDGITGVLTGVGQIKVFNTAGMLVAEGEDSLSIANLESGLYIAICGNETLKFVKK